MIPSSAMGRKIFLILLFILQAHRVFSATPTSFCKCTCFSNSTIIPLNAHVPSDSRLQSRGIEGRTPSKNHGQDLPKDVSLIHPTPSVGPRPAVPADDDKKYHAGTCTDCTRQFCLDYNLPICKKAKLEDVFTTCFQRDSAKDEAVVFIFVIATVGLLLWAAVKPCVGIWIERARERRAYIPLDVDGS